MTKKTLRPFYKLGKTTIPWAKTPSFFRPITKLPRRSKPKPTKTNTLTHLVIRFRYARHWNNHHDLEDAIQATFFRHEPKWYSDLEKSEVLNRVDALRLDNRLGGNDHPHLRGYKGAVMFYAESLHVLQKRYLKTLTQYYTSKGDQE